uniref:Zinc finger protein 131 n=1 Tax=Oncorhynchus tshawytscha TaxID=74940 RepID=A0AAZ3PHN9_ONCTS
MADKGEGCGSQFPDHYKVMLDKLNEQRQLDQFTDITLIVDGHQFRAHKAVLAACSQFFHKFFQDFTQEPLVEIEGVSNSAFRQLMEFTYTATLAVSGPEEVNDVWKAAEYLQMQEAIKALNNRMGDGTLFQLSQTLVAGNSKAKKRKISEILPSVEGEQVEIEVEIGEGTIEVEETGLEEVVDAARNTQAVSDDSALALLADITSKYQQGGLTLHVLKKEGLKEVCSSVFNSWELFKDHLTTHTGEKPNHCTMCDLWFTQPDDLRQHLRDLHGVTDDKLITQELVIAAAATQEEVTREGKGGKRETLLLEDGISVEHVTVEPVGVVALVETAMLVDGEVTEMCEEDIERLKEAGVEIRVLQVSAEGQVNSEIQVEGSEVEVEEDSQPAIAV